MLEIGQQVRILEPFAVDFPGIYTIEDIVVHDDGQVVYLFGDIGGFDIKFLEVV